MVPNLIDSNNSLGALSSSWVPPHNFIFMASQSFVQEIHNLGHKFLSAVGPKCVTWDEETMSPDFLSNLCAFIAHLIFSGYGGETHTTHPLHKLFGFVSFHFSFWHYFHNKFWSFGELILLRRRLLPSHYPVPCTLHAI